MLLSIGCVTTSPTEYYRPKGSAEEPHSLNGKFDPNVGWAGEMIISIDGKPVIHERLAAFSKAGELTGEYGGKAVTVRWSKVRTLKSKYIRADVTINGEPTVSLTF